MRRIVDKHFLFIFSLMLLLQVCIMVFFGWNKEGLICDEVWTFNLANHYYHPFFGYGTEYFNKWLTAADWNKTLTVSVGQEFSYDSVFYNQSQDIHPPLFYVIIHTISSFFPGQVSRWFGYIPNILFFILTQIVLGITIYQIEKDKLLSYFVCLYYGFAWGTINSVLYIRSYMMMTFWGMLAVCMHVSLMKSKDHHLIKLLGVYLAAVCGILSHYYFLIFEFFLSGLYILYCIWNKQYKAIKKYFGIMLTALLTCILFFQPIIQQFAGKNTQGFHTNRAVSNLFHSSFLPTLKLFSNYLNREMFGGLLHILVFIVILYIIVKKCVFIKKVCFDKLSYELSFSAEKLFSGKFQINFSDFRIVSRLLLFLTSVLYFLMIVKISPYTANHVIRFFFIIYPFMSYFLILLTLSFVRKHLYGRKSAIVFIIILILCSFRFYGVANITLMDHSYKRIVDYVVTKEPDIAFVAVNKSTSWFPVVEKIMLMSKIPHSYLIEERDIDKIHNILDNYSKTHNSVLLYRCYDCKTSSNDILNAIKEQTPYNKTEYMGGNVYVLKK